MTKVQFIEGNRRTPDLAPLTEKFMSDLYDEIVVNGVFRKNLAFLEPFLYVKRSFCQDRLGTNR